MHAYVWQVPPPFTELQLASEVQNPKPGAVPVVPVSQWVPVKPELHTQYCVVPDWLHVPPPLAELQATLDP